MLVSLGRPRTAQGHQLSTSRKPPRQQQPSADRHEPPCWNALSCLCWPIGYHRFKSSIEPTAHSQRPRAPLPLETIFGHARPSLLMSAVDVSQWSPPRPLLVPKLLLLCRGFLLLAVRLCPSGPLSLMPPTLTAAQVSRPLTPASPLRRSPAPRLGHRLSSPFREPVWTLAEFSPCGGQGRRTGVHSEAHGSRGGAFWPHFRRSEPFFGSGLVAPAAYRPRCLSKMKWRVRQDLARSGEFYV